MTSMMYTVPFPDGYINDPYRGGFSRGSTNHLKPSAHTSNPFAFLSLTGLSILYFLGPTLF